MTQAVPYLKMLATVGIDWSVPPHRLPIDRSTLPLADLVNSRVDFSGQIVPFGGFTQRDSIPTHSLAAFDELELFLAVRGGVLHYYDGTLWHELYSPIQDLVSYARIGDRVYFSDGVSIGYIYNFSYTPLESILEGVPTADLRDYYQQTMIQTPAGQLVEVHQGRLFSAQGNVLWFSEPLAFHRVNRVANFIVFEGMIKLLKSADKSLYVGDAVGIHVIKGKFPLEIAKETVAVCEVPRHTSVAHIGVGSSLPREIEDPGAFAFVTSDGVCLGASDGRYLKLTGRRLGREPYEVVSCVFNPKTGHLFVLTH